MRIEPPPSEARCSGPMPVAAATAAPALLPPGVRSLVPGVAGDAGEGAVADGLPAELGRGGLAEQHGALLAQARHHGRVLVPGLIAAHGLGAAQRRPAARDHDVLDRGRHAVDQALRRPLHPARLRRPRGAERGLLVDQQEGVERGLQGGDAGQHGTCHLHRRQCLAAVVLEERRGGQRDRIVAHGSHASHAATSR